jgi:NAD(P)-dependent dehydrogenase (short-subunit alcohol dehydrogenase family)
MELTGTVALITGAKRIGAVVATELAARGVDVAIAYGHSEVEAGQTVERVKAAGCRGAAFQADLSNADACSGLVSRVVAEFGQLDILINMASLYRNIPFDQLSGAEWDKVMHTDLRAAFLCAHAAVPHMRKQGGGRIINFSDWVARSGRPRYKGFLAYYVAKAGAMALTEALALELAADNILVNAVAPGPILAPPGTTAAENQAVADATPLGRWGGETEIAKAVLSFLESDFVTGETIRVDGGRHLK